MPQLAKYTRTNSTTLIISYKYSIKLVFNCNRSIIKTCNLKQAKIMSKRINELETKIGPHSESANPNTFVHFTEADQVEMSRLPDSMKNLPTFKEDTIQFIS